MKRNSILSESSRFSLNSQISTLRSDISVYQSKQLTKSTRKSTWSGTKRFLSIKELIQPLMDMFPTTDLQYPVNQVDFWTKFTKSPNAIGHIHFSLRYACTLRTLNVIISHLTGVSNFEKNFAAFPSRVESTFIVALRLQQNRKFLVNKEESQDNSDGLSRGYITLPVRTSSNPYFDQSFVFPVTLNELRYTELVLTVMHTISTGEFSNIEETLSLSDTLNSLTSQQPYKSSQRSLRSRQILEEMKCIGVAFYKVDHEKLVHYPEELLHVWQELFKPLDNHDFTYLGTSTEETMPVLPKEHWKSIGGDNREQARLYVSVYKAEQVGLSRKTMIELSLHYIKQSSELEIHLEKMKYLRVYTNESELIFRAIFCLKNVTQQSLKSQPIELVKIEHYSDEKESLPIDAKDIYIVDEITIPFCEHLSLDMDMNHISYYKDIQIIFEIFLQTNSFCQARCLARIVLGSNAVNINESATLQWNDLITEVNKLKACNILNSTKKITYWHEIDNF